MSDIVVPGGWRDKLEQLAGDRRQTWTIAGLVGFLALSALLLSARSAPATIAPPAVATTPSQAGTSPSASPPAPGGTILVHVAGEVRTPGLFELPTGARVADAIDAAGGPLRAADLDALNLAAVLQDGTKVHVVRRGQQAPASSPSAAPTTGAGTGALVSLNAADQAALETIPGIGPSKATAILEYRERVGSFESIEQLLEVSGIGPSTLEAIRPYVTL